MCYYRITYELQSESTLYSLPKCQGTPCSKQALYLKFKSHQRDSNPQTLSSETNTQPFWLNVVVGSNPVAAAHTNVENKIPNVSDLLKTSDYNYFTSNTLDTKITQKQVS